MICVVCFTGNSGLTDYSLSLCRALSAHTNVTLVTSTAFPSGREENAFFVKRIFRRTRHYIFDLPRFVFCVFRERPKVVLFQSWLKCPLIEGIVVLVFRALGVQCSITIHDLLPHYPRPWSARLLAWYYKKFNKIVVHSKRSAEGLASLGVNTLPLVVPHGVYDIFKTRDQVRADVASKFEDICADEFVALYFGHIETRKGVLEFIKSADLVPSGSRIRFLVAGRDDLGAASAARQAFELARSKPNVTIHDRHIDFDSVQDYFTVADVVVLPYLEGTTSGVMKLAMAFGRPVIATDVGDLRETILDWSGVVVSTDGLPGNLAESIKSVQENYSNFSERVGVCSEKYSWGTIGKAYYDYLSCADVGVQASILEGVDDESRGTL